MGEQHAALELALACDGKRTRPQRALATPPLQLSRARYDDPADSTRLSMTLIHLGGVLAGDQYDLTVDVGMGAKAVVAAAAATQIYSMPQGSAEQRTTIRAAAGASLHWLPGAQLLFAEAEYRQSTHVELAAGAFVMLGELLVPGRLARGERWRFRRYESLIELADDGGRLLAAERIVIEPGRRSPAIPGVMGAFAVMGTLWLLGDQLDAERAARWISAHGGTSVSAAILPAGCGLAVRVLSDGLAAAQAALRHCYTAMASAGLLPRTSGAVAGSGGLFDSSFLDRQRRS